MPDPTAPATPRHPVTEVLHGVTLTDPYRWLEDGTDPAVLAWTEAQNAHTQRTLERVAARKSMAARLAQVLGGGRVGGAKVCGSRIFFTHRKSGRSQAALFVSDPDGTRCLVDPAALNEEGTTALDWWQPSPDGSLLAYGLSQHGDEWSTLQVLRVATGERLGEAIDRTRYATVAWEPDNRGFFYSRYPRPGSVPAGEENYNRHIFYHRLGDDPAHDQPIFGQDRPSREMAQAQLSRSGRYLVITAWEGWNRADVFLLDRHSEDQALYPLAEGLDAQFYTHVAGEVLYLVTNLEAQGFRLLAVDLNQPQRRHWRELLPVQEGPLEVQSAGDVLLVHTLKDAVSQLHVHDRTGRRLVQVALPTLGSVTTMAGSPELDRAYILFESFAIPPALYELNLASGSLTPWLQDGTPPTADALAIKQIFYSSGDGTRIPMFLLHKEGLLPDGNTPTVLSGYGGFNIAVTPSYRPEVLPWLERGHVFAIANLRGGNEYGEAWHRAGMLGNKQNVFDDFLAAAEYLIASGYTRPERLGILGRSNGGLLVGAALTQRPDLFRAVVCGVPLLDMLRYHKFLIGALWISEYGSADDPEQFAWLHAYSPYHRVKDGTAYPAVLLFAAASDSRVDPLHARKMAARLQAATASGRPILLRIESEAGHGAGKPVHKVVAEHTDTWSFFAWQLEQET